jgi:hypothetical protein
VRIAAFLDTNVLLKGFAADRAGAAVPLAICDPDADRYTFEKCVFEAYLAFRGVAGKKPDEGRGRWAESHLNAPADPFPLGKLISKYHDGHTQLGHFWVNNIDSLRWGGLDDSEDLIEHWGRTDEREDAHRELARLRELADQGDRYDALCWHLRDFLERQSVAVLPYLAVFGPEDISVQGIASNVHPACMDHFVRETAIPSEDYEIVFAALRLCPDLFVTDDQRLISAAWSLGLNLPLSAASFCSAADYDERSAECRTRIARAG